MPKYVFKENDNTSGSIVESLSNTVYIPGGVVQQITKEVTVSLGKNNKGNEITQNQEITFQLDVSSISIKPTLISNTSEFDAFFAQKATYKAVVDSGTTIPDIQEEFIKKGKSFQLASALVGYGMYVIYDVVLNESSSSAIGWSKRFTALQDRGLYDVKFLCGGEYAGTELFQETAAGGVDPVSAMIACAEKRGDCIALVDHPQDLSGEGESGDTYATKAQAWVSSYTSSFATGFSPWASNNIVKKLDNVEYPMLPPSFSFLLAYGLSVKTNPNWYAAAGSFRGSVPGLKELDQEYGEFDIDTLQCRASELDGAGDNVGVAVNPICNVNPFGVLIWGNRTTFTNGADGLKASSFLNIRNLVCDIKKSMFKAARKYTFEPNTLQLWLNFCSQITPLLDKAKSNNGILGYKLETVETTAKARLCGKVTIVPIEAVEDFELTVNMEDSIETEESNA